jgi:RND family efflux transporter MFP subunit
MSATMIMGRVLLPASAVLLVIVLAWHAVQTMAVRAGAAATGRGAPSGPPDASAGRVAAEGRVATYPGAEVTVGTEVLGTIVRMPAREQAAVRRGELLVQLRDDEVKASLREARSRLTEAEVALRLEKARSGLDRVLPAIRLQPPQPPEARRDALTAAEARRDAARAAFDRLEAEAAKYRILAPIDGVVIARHADPGETVAPAAPLLTIADLSRLRVEAEVDEFDISRIAPDAPATISAEGYPGPGWRGRVEEVADAIIPRQTRPEDPGRPADTRVLLVRIAFLENNPLKLGQRVEVEIARPEGR